MSAVMTTREEDLAAQLHCERFETTILREQVGVLRETLAYVRLNIDDPEKAKLMIRLALRVTGERNEE